MSKSTVGEVMITEEQIRARAAEIGKEISEEFARCLSSVFSKEQYFGWPTL